MLQLTGHLVFAPDRGENFRKVGKLKTLVLELEGQDGLARFYRQQVYREYGPWCNLAPPLFGLHVTIIRGHGDKFDPAGPQALAGQRLSVLVDPQGLARTPWAKANPGFWYLPVISKQLDELRSRCRVKAVFPFHPHLTIGRENPAFMHAKPPAYPYAVALRCLELIPSSQQKKGEVTGNAQLTAELQAFAASALVNPLCTGDELMQLVARHIRLPAQKAWERAVLAIFEHKELTQ